MHIALSDFSTAHCQGGRPRGRLLLVGLTFAAFLSATQRPAATAQVVGIAGSLVVNEVDYDQPSSDTAEFIEIKNTTDDAIFLGDYDVLGINGATTPGTEYLRIELPNVMLGAGDYYVVGAASVPNVDLVHEAAGFIQNGVPDAVAIVASVPSDPANDYLIDSVSYTGDTAGGPTNGGTWTEGSGLGLSDSSTAPGVGISRVPDGIDTDFNNADLVRSCITPGEANTSIGTGCTPPEGTDPTPTVDPAITPSPTSTSGSTATATEDPTPTATADPSATPTSGATATDTPDATVTTTSVPPETPTDQPVPPTATGTAGATATTGPGPATATPEPTPTGAALAVNLEAFRAVRTSRGVRLSWTTSSEIDHGGFHVVRHSGGHAVRLTSHLIPPRGEMLAGAQYHFLDRIAPPNPVRYYLIDVDTRGNLTWHGPVRPPARKYVPLTEPSTGGTAQ